MSWSIQVTGKAAAVAEKVQQQLSNIKCMEPEESIKTLIKDAICAACSAYPDGSVVMVTAMGSQSTNPDAINRARNTFSVKVEELWGFVE